MNCAQLSFNFDAPAAPAPRAKQRRCSAKSSAPMGAEYSKRAPDYWAKLDAQAREYWRVGAVTSLPLMCDIEGVGSRYAYMLPGVIESIDGNLAAVRIYAAPEYGSFGASGWEAYPLHLALAVNVPLRDLGKYGLCCGLKRVVDAGKLATGDADLAVEIRARDGRANFTHEREMGLVTT